MGVMFLILMGLKYLANGLVVVIQFVLVVRGYLWMMTGFVFFQHLLEFRKRSKMNVFTVIDVVEFLLSASTVWKSLY